MNKLSIYGGKRKTQKKGCNSKRKMKGGEESWGATGMPSQFYGAKPPSKVTSKTNVQPNDAAVVNLSPLKGGESPFNMFTNMVKINVNDYYEVQYFTCLINKRINPNAGDRHGDMSDKTSFRTEIGRKLKFKASKNIFDQVKKCYIYGAYAILSNSTKKAHETNVNSSTEYYKGKYNSHYATVTNNQTSNNQSIKKALINFNQYYDSLINQSAGTYEKQNLNENDRIQIVKDLTWFYVNDKMAKTISLPSIQNIKEPKNNKGHYKFKLAPKTGNFTKEEEEIIFYKKNNTSVAKELRRTKNNISAHRALMNARMSRMNGMNGGKKSTTKKPVKKTTTKKSTTKKTPIKNKKIRGGGLYETHIYKITKVTFWPGARPLSQYEYYVDTESSEIFSTPRMMPINSERLVYGLKTTTLKEKTSNNEKSIGINKLKVGDYIRKENQGHIWGGSGNYTLVDKDGAHSNISTRTREYCLEHIPQPYTDKWVHNYIIKSVGSGKTTKKSTTKKPTKKTSTKKPTTKKPVKKTTTKKPVKKPVKKTTTKKSTTTKKPVKKPVKKTSTKKSTTIKKPVKKPVKKTTTKKPVKKSKKGGSIVRPNDAAVVNLSPWKQAAGNSPIDLPQLLDISKDVQGMPGIGNMSNLNTVPKIGGKKSKSKKPTTKKPATKKSVDKEFKEEYYKLSPKTGKKIKSNNTKDWVFKKYYDKSRGKIKTCYIPNRASEIEEAYTNNYQISPCASLKTITKKTTNKPTTKKTTKKKKSFGNTIMGLFK